MIYAEPLNTAVRKAKHGHRDWLYWKERDGSAKIAPVEAESLKTAMLARGTKGYFTLVAGNSGTFHHMTWPLAICLFRQCRLGWYR